jgi:hypothetical protein
MNVLWHSSSHFLYFVQVGYSLSHAPSHYYYYYYYYYYLL